MLDNKSLKNPVSKSLARRKAGRPNAKDLQGDALREHVITAAADVYGQYGFRGSSVALITKASGVSRPLFYRMFKNSREVIDLIVTRANEALLSSVMHAIANEASPQMMISAGIDAYFNWCRHYGVVVGSIYKELNDLESPASSHRNAIVEKLSFILIEIGDKHGYPRPEPLFVDTLVRTIEHIGSTTFWPKPQSDVVIKKNRAIVQRIIFASIARPEDINEIPPLDSITVV